MRQVHSLVARSIIGAVIGAILIGFVGVVRLLGAAAEASTTALAAYWTVSPIVFIGAVASGAIGGLLFPWARTTTTAILIGLIVEQPIVMTILAARLHGVETGIANVMMGWLAITIVLAPIIGIGFTWRLGLALRYFARSAR